MTITRLRTGLQHRFAAALLLSAVLLLAQSILAGHWHATSAPAADCVSCQAGAADPFVAVAELPLATLVISRHPATLRLPVAPATGFLSLPPARAPPKPA